MIATLIQSLPVPSANANASMNSPISSVRRSRHAASEARGVFEVETPASPAAAARSETKACTAIGTPIPIASPTIVRCAVTDTPSAIIAAPPSAPATVPRLNAAWNRGMIECPRRCSTTAP